MPLERRCHSEQRRGRLLRLAPVYRRVFPEKRGVQRMASPALGSQRRAGGGRPFESRLRRCDRQSPAPCQPVTAERAASTLLAENRCAGGWLARRLAQPLAHLAAARDEALAPAGTAPLLGLDPTGGEARAPFLTPPALAWCRWRGSARSSRGTWLCSWPHWRRTARSMRSRQALGPHPRDHPQAPRSSARPRRSGRAKGVRHRSTCSRPPSLPPSLDPVCSYRAALRRRARDGRAIDRCARAVNEAAPLDAGPREWRAVGRLGPGRRRRSGSSERHTSDA